MANTMPEISKSSVPKLPKNNTFLGVRPGTITKEFVKKKAVEDKKAAEQRAKQINNQIRQEYLGNTATGVKPGYAGKTGNRYKPNPVVNNGAVVSGASALGLIDNTLWNFSQSKAPEEWLSNKRYNSRKLNTPNTILPQNFLYDFKESLRPKNPIEQAKNDAKRDTTNDWMVREQTEKYSLSRQTRNSIIEWGQALMYDSESIYAWIERGSTYQEKLRRAKYVEDWFDNHNNIRPTWTNNPNNNGLYCTKQITETAEMPQWIQPTRENLAKWDYFKTYGFEVNQVNVKAYKDAKRAAVERQINPYSSAFSTDHSEGAIDSYADIFISSDSIGSFINNTLDYYQNYITNPIKHGHLLTAAGNALWNMMDTMDIAARGVRAFVAGDTVLGGSGGTWSNTEYDFGKGTYEDYMTGAQGIKHTSGRYSDAKFDGQNVYWAKLNGHSFEDVKKAQRLFMDNGGYTLLMLRHPNFASKADLSSKFVGMSVEEIEANLDRIFATQDIDWRDIDNYLEENYFTEDRAFRDLREAFKNVKKAYTNTDAAYSANTGSLLGDIVIETVLDPGMIIGGLSKSVVSSGVMSAAETATQEGLKHVLRNADDVDEILHNSKVRAALNELIRQNEGKNIIFKKSDDFAADADLFLSRLRKDSDIFAKYAKDLSYGTADEAAQAFKDTLIKNLMDKQISINGQIVSTQKFARKAIESKGFKAAYLLDKSIDGIDAAIVKSSFLIPWASVKATKLGYKAFMSTPFGAAIKSHRTQKLSASMNQLIDEATGQVNVVKISDVVHAHEVGMIDERSMRASLQVTVDQYDNIASEINFVISDINAGRTTLEEADALIAEHISNITGGAYHTIDELEAYIASLDVRYAGDIRNAFNRLDSAYNRLVRSAYRNADDAPAFMRNQSLSKESIEQGIQAQRRTSDRTLRRKVNLKQFQDALEATGFNDEIVATTTDRTVSNVYERLQQFVKHWEENEDMLYNTGDLMKQIDRLQRSAQFSYLTKWDIASETTARLANQTTIQFNKLRRQIKQLDLISLKDMKVVNLMHADRMALQLEYRNSPEVQRMYREFVEQVVDPILDSVRHLTNEEMDLADSNLIQTLQEIKSIQKGFVRTNNLIDDLSHLQGFNDDHLHTIINSLANNFGFHGDLEDLLANPDILRRKLSATLQTRTGESKVGMKSITQQLQSIGTENAPEVFKAYSDEIAENPSLKRRLNRIINKSTINPSAYVEKQMLYCALYDSDYVRGLDAAANAGQPQIFWHINTTGLNKEIHSITSISARKWVPINLAEGEDITLERLLDAFDAGETKVFQRHMDDAEFNEVSENMLRRMDMKGATRSQMLDEYKKFYGVSAKNSYKSEEDVVREACQYLKDNSYLVDENGLPQAVTPSLIVHDLDGFNTPYLNDKARIYRKGLDDGDAISNYVDNLSYNIHNSARNTYSTLAERIGDFTFSDDQINVLHGILRDYIDEMRAYGSGYRFMDMATYSRRIEDLSRSLNNKDAANKATELESRFLELFNNANGSEALIDYQGAVHHIESFTVEPRGYAFASSDLTRINPTHAALRETGQDTINVESRIYVDDVLSYFNMDAEDGFCVAVEDLKKMHELSRYVIQKRDTEITRGAEEYLSKYKAQCDMLIQSMIDTANNSAWRSTELAYLADLKIPETAVESYLMARKLYNDHLRYWLDEDLATGVYRDGSELDVFKLRIKSELDKLPKDDPMRNYLNDQKFSQILDYYNNYRRRFFDELVGGGFNKAENQSLFELFDERAAARVQHWSDTSDDIIQMVDDYHTGAKEAKDAMVAANREDYATLREYNAAIREAGTEPFEDLKAANAELKAAFKADQKQAWEDFYNFKNLVNARFDEAFAQLGEEFKAHNRAKKEKWETYRAFDKERKEIMYRYKVNTYVDLYAIEEFRDLNDVWQRYNKAYMFRWFNNVNRTTVFEPLKFSDAAKQLEYDKLLTEYNRLQRTVDDSPELTTLREQLSALEKTATNYTTRKSWLQWHGTPKTMDKRAALLEQKERLLSGKERPGWGYKTTKKKIRSVIRDTVDNFSIADKSKKEVVEQLDQLSREVSKMLESGNAETRLDAMDHLYAGIQDIFKNAGHIDDTAYQETLDLRNYLRKTGIDPDSMSGDIVDFNHFKKNNFGRFKFKKGGLSYDEVVDEILSDGSPFRHLFPDGMDEGASGFVDAIDELFSNSERKFIPLEDDELEYYIDKLAHELFDELEARPGYTISTSDEEFIEAYNKFKRSGVPSYESTKAKTDARYVEYREALEENYQNAITETEINKYDALQDYEGFTDFDEVKQRTDERYVEYRESLEGQLEDLVTESEMRFQDAVLDYEEFADEQLHDIYNNIDAVNEGLVQESDDFLSLLEGADSPQIYKKAARSDYEKRLAETEDGIMKQGVDISRKCSEARSEMRSNMNELKRIDEFTSQRGAYRMNQRLLGSTHRKAEMLFNILHETGLAKRPTFQRFMEKVSEMRQLQVQRYRMDALRDANGFNCDRLLEQLVYNGFNMTVFNSHSYTTNEIRELREFVDKLRTGGDDFISYFEDGTTGNVYIYLNNNAIVSEADNARYINQTIRIDRPSLSPRLSFAEFDEITNLIDDIADIEDFRGVYNHLVSCWDDTVLLSSGAINGTSGRIVSRRQAEEFIQGLPDALGDWCTSEGLLQSDLTRSVIYDPGFVRNDTPDILFDFMDTLHRQAAVAREDTMLINMVFNKNDNLGFDELAEQFKDEELMAYFKDNPDYVVCALVPGKDTATGFSLKQLNLNNPAALQMAKTYEHVTVLPHDAYFEMADIMNRVVTDTPYRRLLSKYMLAYKAFALIKPGTWMRNYVDATTKAALDQGGDILSEGVAMIQYEAKAAKGLGLYSKISKAAPELLNEANWDVIQKTFHTDLTYEDFELLRGLVDSERYVPADKAYINRTAARRGGHEVISGQNIGLRDLEEADLGRAYRKFLADENIGISRQQFMDIYYGRVGEEVPPELQEAFEEGMRRLSNNMRRANASSLFDKTVTNMFKPFGTVEQLVRYAQTMYLRDMGMSQNQITKRIHMTQFYNAPSWGTWNKLEAIMPFVTYKYNNVMFWIRMMDENPRYFRYFEDIYGNIVEDTVESMEQQSQDIDYETDYALQSGAIPIGSGKVYFNLGNSFLSAVNDFYGLPHDFSSLNPLVRDALKVSLYGLGFNSKEFFSTVDLDITDDPGSKLVDLIPGAKLTRDTFKTFKNIAKYSSEENGPSMDALIAFTKHIGLIGTRYIYDKNGNFNFQEWQEDLLEQGKWYDCQLGKIVDASQKNEFGANNPDNSFEDVQAYHLAQFGTLWDANQGKFVLPEDYIEGGRNNGYDWENDPEGAWEQLKADMAKKNKYYDYNQRKFVRMPDFISGGLNDPDIDFQTKSELMMEKFGLYWDGNRKAWVNKEVVIPGGLNDTENFSEVMALRLAMFGETYDRDTHHFSVTQKPSILVISNLKDKRFENYYSRLGIPDLTYISQGIRVDKDGLLRTDDGRYIITGDIDSDSKIFEKFKHTFDRTWHKRGWRHYNGWKNYSWKKFNYPKYESAPKFYPKPKYYQSYDTPEVFYRYQFEMNYQYHSPQPGRALHRLYAPKINYPYGGGYNKFSFFMR